MKKQEESQPIDELFARKLGNASLSPSPDGFERLQARMSETQPEVRVVVWRNPAIQRYMAVAACLLLGCLFGWLYLQSDSVPTIKGEQVAGSVNKPQKHKLEQTVDKVEETVSGEKANEKSLQVGGENHLAAVNKPIEITKKNKPSKNVVGRLSENGNSTMPASENEQPVLAQIPLHENKTKTADTTLPVVKTINPVNVSTERVVENTVKRAAPVERVLTVTIEEPTSLVAARQVAKKESSTIAASAETPEKEPKGNLWQQVRRIKQGEVFARRDNPGNEDQGLLGRAYSGLKQSFEKDKSEK